MILINLIIHRGSHQIGGSCIEIFTEKSRIILDIGQELPSMDDENTEKKSKLPNVKGLYIGDDKTIDGILVSHGHGDHMGLLQYTNPQIPVYIGEKAYKILDVTAQFTGNNPIANSLYYLISGKEIRIGDFLITPYLVDHSGFDAYAFIIQAEGKYIVYTGDFRDHGRKKKATNFFIENIPKGVDALLIEGTMMSRIDEIIKSEEDIEREACELMQSNDTPVFILQSSTNIDRLVSMYRATKRSKRIFVMDIFTAHIVSQLNDNIPKPGTFKDIRVFYPYYLTKRMFKESDGAMLMKQFSQYKISREELAKRNDYCMLIRDTMISDLQHIENLKGAGFVYSIWKGYKKLEKTKEILNYAQAEGMKIVDLHTSGHAFIKTLQRTIKSSEPKKIIPIHTENPDLFAHRFENVDIATDGEVITL